MTGLDVVQKPVLPKFHVLVDFGNGVPADAQGPALLHMEMELRKAGFPVEVYKRTMEDDSKVRLLMTKEKRQSL